MTTVDWNELLVRARGALNPRRLSESADAGGVAAALLAEDGQIYTGVCIDTGSSLGFCAEHAAAAAMVTAGANRVLGMVAVLWDQSIIPPCGRCREFIRQLHDENLSTEVLVAKDTVVTIAELLPHS
ncbi:MAG: cytidine deaminase [Anaerolineae bacterium]|nr:cytidine deaminase [Chloroflexota bacterium]